MRSRAILDTGPLVAAINRRDKYHEWAQEMFAQIRPPLITCEPVLAEACFLLGRANRGQAPALEMFSRGAIAVPFRLDRQFDYVARLMRKYGDIGISLADACLVRMAELYDDAPVLTVDGHFKVYRRYGRRVIPTLIPDEA